MGKVQILAVLTMDGCLSSELYDKALFNGTLAAFALPKLVFAIDYNVQSC